MAGFSVHIHTFYAEPVTTPFEQSLHGLVMPFAATFPVLQLWAKSVQHALLHACLQYQ